MRTTFAALSVRNYRVYAASSLLSNVGTWLQNTAQIWLILQLTGSGSAVGTTIAFQLIPSLLFSPVAGAIADKFDKRVWMGWLQVAMAVPAAVLGALAVSGVAEEWHVYLLSFLFGVARAFEAPVRQAFVSELVPAELLSNAVALNAASFNSGRLVGPAVAGVMIAAAGSGPDATGWVIVLNAISYGFVLLGLWMVDPARLIRQAPAPRGRGAVREGIRYVRGRPDLKLLLGTVFCLGAFGMNFQITTALMATDEFGKGAGEFGLLGSFMAIGSLAGALLAARRPQPRLRFVAGAALLFSVVQFASGLMPNYVTYALTMPLLGLMVMTTVTTANALVQMTTAPVMRGRVAALYIMVFLGSTPMGALLIGWVAEVQGARFALWLSGALCGVGVLLNVAMFLRRKGARLYVAQLRRIRQRRRPIVVTDLPVE